MADRIDTFTPGKGGALPKYPWEDWTDGSPWRIHRGQDYDISTESMAAVVRNYARRVGLTVETKRSRDEDFVEFQFGRERDPDGDETTVAA